MPQCWVASLWHEPTGAGPARRFGPAVSTVYVRRRLVGRTYSPERARRSPPGVAVLLGVAGPAQPVRGARPAAHGGSRRGEPGAGGAGGAGGGQVGVVGVRGRAGVGVSGGPCRRCAV